MYKILIPVGDDNDRAKRQARHVRNLPCASEAIEVTITHARTGREKQVTAEMQQPDRVESVRRAKEILEDADIAVATQDVSSPPAEGIVSLATEGNFDEIVISGRKRSPTEKAILGSVTQSVILEADQAVTVVN
ncbi:Nucleotide-binding protein, UspA family [Halanaeroarchaeum sp. HSR-CO]|uniref:universal stress protein n=1 Tax=Halanaeroarchaeum sp. HSR-CO TaxID=2866382 RepID=UPI00217D3AAC|nr:universal stress protein [Halanaeroarchaeum sp. HSR-CO]UWG47080.1 Nucleotide-binding protein, UspA family [Halanaeroarchaeum sp. HSR-CO]